MENSWKKRDSGITIRIIICLGILSLLYIVFITVLAYLGLGFFPIMVISAIFILSQWFFSDRLVMWSTGAKLVTKEQYGKLHSILEKVAYANNLPKPKIAIVNSQIPNAFATGKGHRNSVVAVTSGLLDILDSDELEGVLAHEITHIKNRDVLVITLASLFSTLAWQIMQFGFFGSMYGVGRDRNNGGAIIIVIAVAFITWIVSFLIIRAISRYREYSADRGAAQTTRKPVSLANALLKITGKMNTVSQKDIKRVEGYNAFFIIPAISRGSLASLFSTHPPVENRIQKLMDMEKSMHGI